MTEPLASPEIPNAGNPAVPSSINMPDHEVRQEKWFQIYVRLARPTLDWVSVTWLTWCSIVQPLALDKFDITATGMAMAWCATVYGIKTFEKTKGVA